MIRSMTGFGTADGAVGSQRVSVEVRTVNHRFFNPSIKLPGALARWEGDVREALRQRIARGHVSLSARVTGDAVDAVDATALPSPINDARFAAYVALFRDLQARHGLSDALDVATILRMPDVFSPVAPDDTTGSSAELIALVEAAVAALNTMRTDEGSRLATVLQERLATVAGALDRSESVV